MDRKIVIADIDENLMLMMEAALAVKGYRVITSISGKDAFQKIKREKPDLVIIDTALPEMSGYQLVHKMHMEEELKRIPVIVMSEKTQMKELFTSAEIHSFMAKPILPKVLMKEVEDALKAGGTSKAYAQADQKTVMTLGIEGFLFDKIKKFLTGHGCVVASETDAGRVISMKPRLIMAQYDESPGGGAAGDVYREIKRRKESSLNFIAVCPEPLLVSAVKEFPQDLVVKYKDAADLCERVAGLLKKG